MDTENCSVCLDVKQNPVWIDCGHSFCQTCVESYVRINNDARCPLCRQPFLFGTRGGEIRNEISTYVEESDDSQPDDDGSSILSLLNINFDISMDDDSSYSGDYIFEELNSSNGDTESTSMEISDNADEEESELEDEIIELMEESDDSEDRDDVIQIDSIVYMECDSSMFICETEDSSDDNL